MRASVLLGIAVQAIRRNAMRTLLTTLGIVIGVGAVLLTVAVGLGARQKIRQQIDGLGTNLVVVTPGASGTGGVNQGAGSFNRLTIADVRKLQREATTVAATRASSRGSGPRTSSERANAGSVKPCSRRVPTVTIRAMRTRTGRRGVSSGKVRAAARVTTPRIPAQELTAATLAASAL